MSSPAALRGFAAVIFATVFGLNMLSSSREIAWGDAHGMWDVAVNMLTKQDVAIDFRWPEDIPPGRDGRYYGITPIGTSMVHLPGAALASAVNRWAPQQAPLLHPLTVHLGPAALGAAACALLFLLCVQLGAPRRGASMAAAITAVATTTWVYARYPYSEVAQLCAFTWLALATMRAVDAPTRTHAVWFGISAGCLLNTKYVFAIAIVGAAATVGWKHRRDRAALNRLLGWTAVGAGPLLALALWYNWVRWGSVTSTGYDAYLGAFFGGSLFDGAWGMLLSANKSVFLFSPPLVLACIGLPAVIRSRPFFGLFLAFACAPVFLVYASYRSWSGDYAWGPRFVVFAVPVLCVGLAWFTVGLSKLRKAVLIAVVTGGIAVQLLGNALYWDHFIRVSISVKNQWLGNPNRAGAYIAENGRGHCDSCFEDTYQTTWTPAFQQIKGHYWLVRSMAANDDWKTALKDAPWRRYSTLPVSLADTFPRARLDWWVQLWRKDAPHTRTLGIVLLLTMLCGFVLSLRAWVRRHRSEEPM